MCLNVLLALLFFKHFAIPAIAYVFTIAMMITRFNAVRHTKIKVDFFAKTHCHDPQWQQKMISLWILTILISGIFYLTLFFTNHH